MKKIKQIWPALVIGILLFSGCAKERQNYDNWLTSKTWNLTSGTESDKTTTTTTTATLITVNPREVTTTFDGTTSTYVNYDPFTNTPGTTTFTRITTKKKYTLTVKFSKDGTYEINTTGDDVSNEVDTETANGLVVNLPSNPITDKVTGTWSWDNADQTKKLITTNQWGTAEITIKKNSLVLTKTYSNYSTNTIASPQWSQTIDEVMNNSWTFSN